MLWWFSEQELTVRRNIKINVCCHKTQSASLICGHPFVAVVQKCWKGLQRCFVFMTQAPSSGNPDFGPFIVKIFPSGSRISFLPFLLYLLCPSLAC